MKTSNPAGVTATFVSAVLSLLLPASAFSAEIAAPPPPERPPVHSLADDRAAAQPSRSDPILTYKWGPGDPDVAVATIHFALSKRRD